MEDTFKKLDKLAEEKPEVLLTEEGKKAVLDIMGEAAKKDPTVVALNNVLADPKGPESGESTVATVAINSETGEKTVVDVPKDQSDDISFEEKLENIGNSIDNIEFNEDVDINEKDIASAVKESNLLDNEGFEISDDAALELVKMLNKYKETGSISYKDFPEETKKYFDKYFEDNGIRGYNVQANTMRNMVAEAFADELRNNITLKKFNEDFNKQIEGIFDKMNEEVSPIFMDFNNQREEYIKKLTENIEDEEKKARASAILDSIHDAFELTRLIEAAPKTKIKHYFLEKPEKIYDMIIQKYRDNKYHIYDLSLVAKILDQHLKSNGIISEDDNETTKKVMIVFSLFCSKYKVEVPEEHAFMYYFTYTVVLLNIYKNEEYKKFAPAFLANVKKVIDNLRK